MGAIVSGARHVWNALGCTQQSCCSTMVATALCTAAIVYSFFISNETVGGAVFGVSTFMLPAAVAHPWFRMPKSPICFSLCMAFPFVTGAALDGWLCSSMISGRLMGDGPYWQKVAWAANISMNVIFGGYMFVCLPSCSPDDCNRVERIAPADDIDDEEPPFVRLEEK